MSDAITTQSGAQVGNWDGVDVKELQKELNRIRQQLKDEGGVDKISAAGMPHRDQFPEDLLNFRAYPIWGIDNQQNCLCGARANRIVSVEDVRQYSMVEHH